MCTLRHFNDTINLLNGGDILNLKDRRQELGLTLEEVGKMTGVGKSTVRKWETGYIENMRRDKIVLLAKALKLSPIDILYPTKKVNDKDVPTLIYETSTKLTTGRQQNVYNYAKDQLEQQNHPNVYNIEEAKEEHTVDVLGAVSAGTGEWLDGQSKETVTIEGPIPKYDFAVRVNGNSMEPTFSDGEILFVNKVDEARNNQFVVAEVNGEAFVKKLFVSMDGVKLISLNRDYDDIVIHDYDDYQIVGVVVL